MTSPFISIVIPCGGENDRTRNLHYALVGLEQQTFKDFEVVIVNDGSLVDYLPVIRQYPELHIKYIWQPKYQPSTGNMPPRNTGALLARADYILTLDSDNVLEKSALAYYVEDIECEPNRVICGQYHWLPNLSLTEGDIKERWGEIITDWDWKSRTYNGNFTEILPSDGSHNIMLETRTQFQECTVHELHDGMNDGLACYGGNILFPKDIWFDCGGNADWLIAGLCDDGALGLEVYFRKHKISFDARILAGHLWHPRNRQWVVEQSRIEADKLNRVYKLDKYADGSLPEHILKEHCDIMKKWYRSWGYKYDDRLVDVPVLEPKVDLVALDKQTLEKAKNWVKNSIRLLKPADEGTVYALVDGWLHGIPNPEVLYDLGFTWSDVQDAHPNELLEYHMGSPFPQPQEDGKTQIESTMNELNTYLDKK